MAQLDHEMTYPDRLKLPFEFDVDRMSHEIDTMRLEPYIYYSSTMIGIPKPGTKPGPDDPPTSLPYFRSIIDQFREHTKVTLARVLRLEPGSEVKEHCDPMLGIEIDNSVIRLTIPISGQDGVLFYLNDDPVPMTHGECWYMRLSDQHRVLHNGPVERINFTLDMEPNDWFRGVMHEAMAN